MNTLSGPSCQVTANMPSIFEYTQTSHHDTYPAINPSKVSLVGRSVLITGSSRGIGKAAAISFAQAGVSQIVVTARSVHDLDTVHSLINAAATAAGKPLPEVLKVALNVADEASVYEFAKIVNASVGKLDILINNAGVMVKFADMADSDPTAWWTTWDVNVKGVYLVTRALLPLMLKGGDGIIINVSSIGAHMYHPGASAYETSKLAVLRLTEFIMSEYGSKGILAISYHPGGVQTDMAENLPTEIHDILIDTPELAGDVLVWLTKERREWLAGRYVSCTWDLDELEAMKDEIVAGDKLKVKLVL